LLPILLGLAGGAVDLARAYQAWLTVEAATRDAAEFVAVNSCAADKTCGTNTGQTDAQRVVCSQSTRLPGYIAGSGGTPCTAPAVTASASASTTALGATANNPIITAQVRTTLDFRTLVPWPLVPNATITLGSNKTYSVVWGR
jgi:Flp pilus assembly protein TadG